VSGSGKPDRKSLLKLAAAFAIKTQRANNIIEGVLSVVIEWPRYAAQHDVSKESVDNIEDALAGIRNKF